eukprot:jgi/Mesvir1/28238/Mv04783-RA.1
MRDPFHAIEEEFADSMRMFDSMFDRQFGPTRQLMQRQSSIFDIERSQQEMSRQIEKSIERTRESLPARGYERYRESDSRIPGGFAHTRSYERVMVFGGETASASVAAQQRAGMAPNLLGFGGLAAALSAAAFALAVARFWQGFRNTSFRDTLAERVKLCALMPFLLLFSDRFRQEFQVAVMGPSARKLPDKRSEPEDGSKRGE